jgi:VWFA-related protein
MAHDLRVRQFLRGAAAFLLATSVSAQQAQQAGPSIPPPTIRVTTHMVLVDVVVTDKQGKAIAGLKPEDFTIEENGKAQKIASLTTPADNAAGPAAQLPPGIYSNKPQYRSTGPLITVMLLDALNTPFTDQAYARSQMLAFVKANFKPADRMAIFTLTGSLNVLQDFTSDPQTLYTALQRYKAQPQTFGKGFPNVTSSDGGPSTASSTVASLDASTPPPSDSGSSPDGLRGTNSASVASTLAALQSFESGQAAYAKDQWAVMTLNALNSIARILGGLPGRKNLIWVTGDLPFSFIPEDRVMTSAELAEDLPSMETRRVGEHSAGNYAATFRASHAEEIRETASRLASAQVAVYPVDARGLTLSTDIDSQETMREMARETGGRAYVNQNEIKVGVERAFADESAAYTIGYYPENKKYDNKYRSIKVKVKRDGVDVQNRRGYYAIDPTQIKGYNPQVEVASALGDIVPSTMVTFTAQVKPPSANSVPGKIGVTYLVDASTLSAEDASGGKRLNVVFYASIFSGGKIVSTNSQKVDQTFDANTYQQIVQKGMMLHLDLDPKPGALRLAVQDARTGMVGTINATVP